MSRLGHAVAPLDGIVELVVHGQLWVRRATCNGAESGTYCLRVWGVAECLLRRAIQLDSSMFFNMSNPFDAWMGKIKTQSWQRPKP